MVGKQGYLKILEAVIAIVIILGLVIFILPKANRNVEIPPDLELTAQAILDEVQNNEDIRNCVLNIYGSESSRCIHDKIDNILGDNAIIWMHAERLCEIKLETVGLTPISCDYIWSDGTTTSCDGGSGTNCLESDQETDFNNLLASTKKDIYTKSVTIKSPDIIANPTNTGEVKIDDDCSTNEDCLSGTVCIITTGDAGTCRPPPNQKQLRLFFWSKV